MDSISGDFLIIFANGQSIYLQNTIGQILLHLRYHACGVKAIYELKTLTNFQKF